MIKDDDRIDFSEAVKLLEQELGMSTGEAEFALQQLCADRKVRSEKERYAVVGKGLEAGPLRLSEPKLIERREWRDRDVDLMIEEDGSWYFVTVSKGDVRYWLDNQPKPKQAKSRRSEKREWQSTTSGRSRRAFPTKSQILR